MTMKLIRRRCGVAVSLILSQQLLEGAQFECLILILAINFNKTMFSLYFNFYSSKFDIFYAVLTRTN